MTQPYHNIFCSTRAHIPISVIQNQRKNQLAYAYYLDHGNSVQYEQDAVKRRLRTLYTILNTETVDEIERRGQEKVIWREKIDGVIGFGDSAAGIMSNAENLTILKRELIENLLPRHLFDPTNADIVSESKEDLRTVLAIRETLITEEDNSSTYKSIFEDVRH